MIGLFNRLLRPVLGLVIVVARDNDTGKVVRLWMDKASSWPLKSEEDSCLDHGQATHASG